MDILWNENKEDLIRFKKEIKIKMNRFFYSALPSALSVVITAVMLLIVPSMTDADDVNLEFILGGIKYNDSLFKNCNVKMSYAVESITYPEGANASREDFRIKDPEVDFSPALLQKVERERWEYDIILKEEKERVEEKVYKYGSPNEQDSIKLIQHHLWAYDGEKTRRIYYSIEGIKGATAELQGTVWSGVFQHIWNIPLVFADFLGRNISLSDYPDIKLVGKTRLDGYECYLLEGSYKNSGSRVKIWVAQEVGFRPLRIESYSKEFEVIQKYDYEGYNGIWAIKHETFQSFFKKSESEKLRLSERGITVNKIEFICPPEELPDSVFVLEFPTPIEKIWDADREIYIDVPSSEEDEEDTPLE